MRLQTNHRNEHQTNWNEETEWFDQRMWIIASNNRCRTEASMAGIWYHCNLLGQICKRPQIKFYCLNEKHGKSSAHPSNWEKNTGIAMGETVWLPGTGLPSGKCLHNQGNHHYQRIYPLTSQNCPIIIPIKPDWWFGTCFSFPYIGNNHPNWLIVFRGVEITNQKLNFKPH